MINYYEQTKTDERLYCIMCHPSDEGTLIVGDDKTAVVDCGMAFCAKEKIAKIKQILSLRKLDYIITGHSHYDHIGSIPHLRTEWPDLKVISSEYAAKVFTREGALKTIRALSGEAARCYAPDSEEYAVSYSDDAFHTDIIVYEGDVIDLGGISLKVIATPGHTRDAISFNIPEYNMIKADETLGVLTGEDSMYPVYLVSYLLAKEAVKKCRAFKPSRIWSPHFGEVNEKTASCYFDLADKTLDECRDMIITNYKNGKAEDEIIELFAKKYRNQNLIDKQPEEAFRLNTAVTVKTTIAECL